MRLRTAFLVVFIFGQVIFASNTGAATATGLVVFPKQRSLQISDSILYFLNSLPSQMLRADGGDSVAVRGELYLDLTRLPDFLALKVRAVLERGVLTFNGTRVNLLDANLRFRMSATAVAAERAEIQVPSAFTMSTIGSPSQYGRWIETVAPCARALIKMED